MGRSLPVVDVSGPPYAQGLGHGRAAKGQVARNVDTYLRRFTEWGKVPRDEVRLRSEMFLRRIEAESPEYAEAMRGIADGSEQHLLDIVAVNLRYEMMYSEFAHRGMEKRTGISKVGGCTSVAVLPEFAANGHLLLGQNWDWIPEVEGLVIRAAGPDGFGHLAFTEAGIAGAKIGLNAVGLGLAINGLVSSADRWSSDGTPFHVRCWKVLAARTLHDAERILTTAGRSVSSNFLVAQAGTGVVDLEVAPTGTCRVAPENGYLAHTNHFLDEKALGVWQPLAEDRPSTFTRYATVQRRLASWAEAGRQVGLEDLQEMLRDHANAPNSVCRHSDERLPLDDRYETVVSVIMDLDAREMHIAPGTPCTAKHQRIPLSDA